MDHYIQEFCHQTFADRRGDHWTTTLSNVEAIALKKEFERFVVSLMS